MREKKPGVGELAMLLTSLASLTSFLVILRGRAISVLDTFLAATSLNMTEIHA